MFQSTEYTSEYTSESTSQYKMPFGKYKGLSLNELDAQYLNFLLVQEWFNSKDILQSYCLAQALVK